MKVILLKLLQVQTAFARNHYMMIDDSGGGQISPVGAGQISPVGAGQISPVGGGDIVFTSPLGGYSNLQLILDRVINGLLILATPVVVIMILWAGYQFIVSGGSPDKITKARQTILWAAVGYGILLLSRGITFIIQQLLTGY